MISRNIILVAENALLHVIIVTFFIHTQFSYIHPNVSNSNTGTQTPSAAFHAAAVVASFVPNARIVALAAKHATSPGLSFVNPHLLIRLLQIAFVMMLGLSASC